MKTIIFFLLSMSFFLPQANAQVSASATATARIMTALSITKNVDMNFGYLGSSTTSGTVTLSPVGSRTESGGVSLFPGGTVSAASFSVAGDPNTSYAITLPSGDHTISSGGNNMTVNAFTSSPSGTGLLDGSGNQTLTVGETLNVDANQANGIYVSGEPFVVIVAYN